MPNNSSHPDKPINLLQWCSRKYNWPYEIVSTIAQVTTNQQQHIFEWAVLRIMETFAGNLPTLEQAANELGFKDPVFLVDALERLIESGVVEQIDPGGLLELQNCRLTNLAGAQGSPSGSEPERHGLRLCFDALTGDYITPVPTSTHNEPEQPLLPAENLPALRAEIGLHTARQIAEAQNEQFLADGARITNVEVLTDQGYYTWEPLETVLGINSEGTMHCTITNGTENQQQWLDSLDLKLPDFDQLLNISALGQDKLPHQPAVNYDKWFFSIDSLVDPDALNKEVSQLLDTAQSQIFLHAYCFVLPGVSNAVIAACKKGVLCIIFGRRHQLDALPGQLKGLIKTHELNESTDLLHEVSLLIDGEKGLAVDKVQLKRPRGRRIQAFLAARLINSQVQAISKTLTGPEAGIK